MAFSAAVALSVIICAGIFVNLFYVVPALLIQPDGPNPLTIERTNYWTFFVGYILLGITVVTVGTVVYLRRRLSFDPPDHMARHPLRSQAKKELCWAVDRINTRLNQ